MSVLKLPAVELTQDESVFYLAKIRAKDLMHVSYVSVRGRDDEPGAVQRFLNPRRISSIRDFALNQRAFPSSIILNWMDVDNPVEFRDGVLFVPPIEAAAQLIDGQHRVAGISEAFKEDRSIGELELPVSIYLNLSTKECANIFLSINTEQKPVPRSLVYDLYQIADNEMLDPAAARARDIVDALNTDGDSPYFNEIKVPGSPRRKGGVALSTAVSAIKPLVEHKGAFEQIGIDEYELQKKIIKNFFISLAKPYGDGWGASSNAFIYASGFTGAIDFLSNRMLPYCNAHGRDFSCEFMSRFLNLNENGLILQGEVKGVQGKEAPKKIFELLVESFSPAADKTDLKV